MKNNNLILLFLLLSIYFQAYSYAANPISAWPRSNFPIRYVMDRTKIPVGVVNSNSNRSEMIRSVDEWNQNGSLGSMVYIVQGAVDNSPNAYELTNNINEIKFFPWDDERWPTYWDAATQNLRKPLSGQFPCINTPRAGCLRQRFESDIYFNPYSNMKQFFVGESAPSNCSGLSSANAVLKHEIGHGLGIEHFGSQLMAENLYTCEVEHVRSIDFRKLKRVYYGADTVSINIQSPSENQAVIINQQNTFTANINSFSRSNLTAKQKKDAEDNMVWKSSVDGEIGIGNDITPILNTGGLHELTVTVGQPGDAIYGENFSSFYVVDTTQDIIGPFGTPIMGPYPCPRRINSANGACYFEIKHWISHGGCTYPARQGSDSFNKDTPKGSPFGTGYEFSLKIGDFPQCIHSDPGRWLDYDIGSWIWDVYSPEKVRYFSSNDLIDETFLNDVPIPRNYQLEIPLVEPEIYVAPIADCNVTNITEKCSVEVNYEGKYFLPDAGLYYKPSGTPDSSYVLHKRFKEGNSGSINTSNIVTVNGIELAIFQYSHHIRHPNGGIMVRAPDGMVAGPFNVNAISSDTTYPPPELLIAETTCANHYCIKLSGHYFAPNSTVDIRLQDIQPLLKHVPASDIYTRTTENGKDVLIFPINEIYLQNHLNTSSLGLCFWVSNPTNWTQPLCTKRTSSGSQSSFMGKTVTSYRQNDFDKEYNSYEVKNNGQDLEIWGNSWKKIASNYNVTQNTVLEFSVSALNHRV
ncbi:hypothetical protein MNBD_GAMMA03-1832 [hydrothermal vent metagenome]|uniref:Uncharacterized protein n=1 Tax=hydrothermal vent metagenome TaxID=652676 RepID=A0A3B0W4E6_9ZZZZ